MNVYIPLYLGDFVNALSRCTLAHEGFVSAVYVPTLRLCSSYVLQSLSTFLYIGLLGSVGERIAKRMRIQLFRKLVYQDMAYYDVHSSGKLVEIIGSDVQNFKSSFKQCVSQGLRNIIQVVGSVFALLSISPTLTATLLGCLPCVFLIGSLMGTELRHLSREVQAQHSQFASLADEIFSHIRTVKSLTMEDLLIDKVNYNVDKVKTLSEKLAFGIGSFQGLSNLTLNGVVLGVLYVGGHLMSRGELDAGHLMSFLATTQTLQRSLSQLSLLYGQIVRGSTALKRIHDVLKLPSGIESIPSSVSNQYVNDINELPYSKLYSSPCIEFSNVQFVYPNRPETTVLNDLSVFLPGGKVIALVGQSGAGKSTVVSLMERFYDPVAGEILLNNHKLSEFSVNYIRSKLIGYISQEPQIFNASIRENIRFGRFDATDEEVEEAAKLAHAHEFISHDLPYGYDTIVGQGSGTTAGLSGGQRQRIAIARILLKNAPILLMDEATSALDAESEAKVQDALNNAMKGRTVLIIAHRLSTVRKADLILVMSKGQIVEKGTHSELMANHGYYYNLVQRQEGSDVLDN
ncbi:ATP-binding cassette sub-family B member 8 [Schistosoma japonicum]|uniref:Mitochondrial potassium channel ATP-binding subunit n=2 Tax=Schistosoma japonicum TaxID=6182 RepID=A0A4Z2DF86_SCHJA|nr:ATP-binding cassette sub-family B member 8 [Schistosoma japonicum]